MDENKKNIETNEVIEITAIEDLMREHGLLNRILLIYEEIVRRLNNNEKIKKEIINKTALIIRKFVEEYHEKTEENYVFPILLKKNIETLLIQELIKQHNLGRQMTNNIIQLTNNDIKDLDKKELIININNYVKMYRYHETREDTIIFQDFRKSLTKKKYEELGEKFEEEEKKVIG